jgi:hypothetical protein
MIQLEYDQQTAGVRVSFVICDKLNGTLPDGLDVQLFCKQGGKSVDGSKWVIPQNTKTLETVKTILERVIDG